MKKYLAKILIFLCLFTVLFGISGLTTPLEVRADHHPKHDGNCVKFSWQDPDCEGPVGELLKAAGVKSPSQYFLDALLLMPGWIAIAILKLAQLLVYMSGTMLNEVVNFTVIGMAENLKKVAINDVWTTVRDVANMGFIFILLYASIQLILGIGKNTKQLIINMIIVALLINFSLFFTKIVIDVSNMLAVTVYEAIAPGALEAAKTGTLKAGLSNTMMEPLDLQTISKNVGALNGSTLLIVGVMGTIFCLIAAFTFFAISIMFIIRFVVLIFVLILSPLAFVSLILPQLSSMRKKWSDALIGQSFFAPIYFFLTWIVIVLSKNLYKNDSRRGFAEALTGSVKEIPGVNGAASTTQIAAQAGDIQVIMNFIIMIAFLIITLMIAKDWAGRAGPAVGKATQWLTGKASNAAFGTVGWAGRTTIGNAGLAASNNARLQELAKDGKGLGGAGARLALYASRKARSGSFDARSATIPTAAIGDLIGGTVGRTKIGKKMGLDEVNIPSIEVGSIAASQTGVGAGGTKGKKEFVEEKEKRIAQRNAQNADELALATAKRDVLAGAFSTDPAKIEAMEKALSKLNDKQTESLVAGNRELLTSQEFANRISVQQLEALNKSEQLSEDEKNMLKTNRFKDIRDGLPALAIDPASRTADQQIAADKASKKIKGLADKELELMPIEDLTSKEFIAEMRGPQFETIQKSSKFTSGQKTQVKDVRKEPLLVAFNSSHLHHDPTTLPRELNRVKKMGGKDYAELMREKIDYVDHTGTAVVGAPLLAHPEILAVLKPNMLKKMALELNGDEINTLRTALIDPRTGTDPQTLAWLNNPAAGGTEFA